MNENKNMNKKGEFINLIWDIRNKFVKEITNFDPSVKLEEILWERDENNKIHERNFSHSDKIVNGGVRTMMSGDKIEKSGIHISIVSGKFSEEFVKYIPGTENDNSYQAIGVSTITHPFNPHAPNGHMNVRYIKTSKEWVGGGMDLNPMLQEYRQKSHSDSLLFHEYCKRACSGNEKIYQKYAKKCDDYFFLPHRNEPRGIGGIFFDYVNSGDWHEDFNLCKNTGFNYIEAYLSIIKKNCDKDFSEAEKNAQLLQRGRYAEFNLLYDRGTKFGLMTGGNVNSILSSLPPEVKWA